MVLKQASFYVCSWQFLLFFQIFFVVKFDLEIFRWIQMSNNLNAV